MKTLDFSNPHQVATIENGSDFDVSFRLFNTNIDVTVPAMGNVKLLLENSIEAIYYTKVAEQLKLSITMEEPEPIPSGETAEVDTADALAEAINNPDVSNIKLTADISDAAPMSFGRAINIDGQGKTLTFSQTGSNVVLSQGGTIKDLVIVNASAVNTRSRNS